ncbi:hypothetical protein K505DRAFT_275507 [Melanomma pulvis-pyrius CBS 109.77]|uniref:3-carboxymuconate cyclase n=1 Tax=Melanomma pulvis-pyrius CBS 109.77 TaxID=1314802 RepID=A0A6A6XDB0_9PLEO|nr:hypothetical protein K505DRAFT_275507 [Melanomma pulvis-pyrius CBS 109.77]
MHFTRHALISALVAPAILASPISSSKSSVAIQRRHQKTTTGKAVYLITNGVENAVAAVLINADGTLGDASVTATGGCGGVSLNAMGKPATPDALVAQSSLTIAGQNIFAVNAGSNTVSMFAISPSDPLSLQLVGEPAAVPGSFPNTVAASVKNSLVCVGTTGSKAGISCANFDAQNGIGAMDALRPFDIGQSDPPVGPTNTVSQTFFSEDQTMLFTTVKGDPAVNNTGFLSVFPIDGNGSMMNSTACGAAIPGASSSKLSMKEMRSSPAGTAVLFGSQPIPGANPPMIFATDASFGAGILSIDSTMSATLAAKQALTDQKATCWATISTLTNTAFVTDVGINRIVEMSLKDASIVGIIDLSQERASAQDPGLIDLRAAGAFVYALSPGNGTTEAAISVVDITSKKLVQHATLGGIGVGSTAQGMAILV